MPEAAKLPRLLRLVDLRRRRASLCSSAPWGASCPRQGSSSHPVGAVRSHEPSSCLYASGLQAPPEGRSSMSQPRQLTAHTSLEVLKKEAKRWLKALRSG